jgi:ERCC4-type nuclease
MLHLPPLPEQAPAVLLREVQSRRETTSVKVIIDTREQLPFAFDHAKYAGTVVEAGTLDVGDYSLAGLTDRCAVERKALSDLVSCLGSGRERFERELQRAAALDAFAVVVEASWADLAGKCYRSQMNAHAACQSVLAFACRYRIPFFFAGSRAGAEYVVWGYLRQFLETARKRWGGIVKAHGDEAA